MLAIDERAGCVRVNNSGTVMTLTFGPQKPVQQTVIRGEWQARRG